MTVPNPCGYSGAYRDHKVGMRSVQPVIYALLLYFIPTRYAIGKVERKSIADESKFRSRGTIALIHRFNASLPDCRVRQKKRKGLTDD